jgi:hypothetical protein
VKLERHEDGHVEMDEQNEKLSREFQFWLGFQLPGVMTKY